MRFISRTASKWYAAAFGYFWLPCPTCGVEFSGNEWRDVGGHMSSIPKDGSRSESWGICPACTAGGEGCRAQATVGKYHQSCRFVVVPDVPPHPRSPGGEPMTFPAEQWETGDVVLAADGGLWVRAAPHHIEQGWPWAYCTGYAPRAGKTPPPEGSVCEDYPVRPLVLLVRDGVAVGGAQ